MVETLSLPAARRIALAAQGFARERPAAAPVAADLRRVLRHTQLLQIDSVNVLARAHYLPLFSRLGVYDRALLEAAAWGPKPRRLFEYWAHEASILPVELQPLLRWRMARAERGEGTWKPLADHAGPRRAEAMALLRRIETDGPLAASDLEGRGAGGWWGWSPGKRALEWLFWAGLLTTRTRRGGFERVYDLPARVLPRAVLETPTPSEPDAHRELIARAARAHGVGVLADLRDYFRQSPADARRAADELVEEGELIPVTVRGWFQPAFLHKDARRPRRIEARALLAPFDPLVWARDRTERLFAMRFRIEIYTPAEKRTHGYYVLPFLLDEALVARVDLKADRAAGVLRVQAAHREPGAPAHTAEALAVELRLMADWLKLDQVTVAAAGDLAAALADALSVDGGG